MVSLRATYRLAALLAASIASLLAACGGKVVVDAEGATGGSGGASTTVSTASTGVFSTGVGAGGCEGLQADFEQKLATAQSCDPALNVPQCSGTNTTFDLCGCLVTANDSAFTAAQLASKAFNDWVGGGCGPFECFACPPPPPSPWFCDETSQICKPAFIK